METREPGYRVKRCREVEPIQSGQAGFLLPGLNQPCSRAGNTPPICDMMNGLEGFLVSNSGRKSVRLTGTAILAAMVIVFDYTLKYSGLKIPFPWMPFLKFDFTGIPIVVALLLYGLPSATATSLIASLGIIIRSGDLIGGPMKGIAELSTVAGRATALQRDTPPRGSPCSRACSSG